VNLTKEEVIISLKIEGQSFARYQLRKQNWSQN